MTQVQVSREMEKHLNPQIPRVPSGGTPSVSPVKVVYTVWKNNHQMLDQIKRKKKIIRA